MMFTHVVFFRYSRGQAYRQIDVLITTLATMPGAKYWNNWVCRDANLEQWQNGRPGPQKREETGGNLGPPKGGERHKVDRAYRTESVFVALRWLSHEVKRLTILRFILLYPFLFLFLLLESNCPPYFNVCKQSKLSRDFVHDLHGRLPFVK